VADPPETAASTSVDNDEPLAAFAADDRQRRNPWWRVVVVLVVLAVVAGVALAWWRQRPADPHEAAREAAAACDAFDAKRSSGSTISDFSAALDHSRRAVALDPIWSSLDSSLFSAIDALVYLRKVPPSQAQGFAAQTKSVQYLQASDQLAEQCALAHAAS
jgi:hypothetical protein